MTPLKTTLGIVFIICLTIVIFTFITRDKLCEFSIKSEHQEVAAKLACNAGLTSSGGTRVPPGLWDAEVLTHPFFSSVAAIILRGVYPDDKNP